MTTPTDRPEDRITRDLHVAGQLDFHGFTGEEADDFAARFADRLTELQAERTRLDLAQLAHRTSALEDVKRYTVTASDAESRLDAAVAEARALGATWREIGDAARMTRQSAWRRWRTPEETEPEADQ